MNGLPAKSDLRALRQPIIGKAPNPTILDGVVFHRKRVYKVFTVDDPMPTIGAPVRIRRPVVNFIRIGFEFVGVHAPNSTALN